MPGSSRRVALALLLISSLTLAACVSGSDAGQANPTVTVFAAASLTSAFGAIGQAYESEQPGMTVEFNFAGSQTLATQLIEGAPADVFAPADLAQMERAVRANAVMDDWQVFARNTLVIILPKDNPAGVESMFDLGGPALKLVVGAESVPVGAYTREFLDRLAAAEPLRERHPGFDGFNIVSNEVNVLQVVTRVRLGEADAGIVYATDVTPEIAADLRVISIPEPFNVVVEYPIAPVTDAAAVEAFVAFVLSPTGQQILADWGFQPVTD